MYIYFLLLVILGISCHNITTENKNNSNLQMKVEAKIQPENNFDRSVEIATIISNTVNEEDIFVNELYKLLVKNFKLHRKIDSKGKNKTQEMMRQRKSRDAMNGTDLEGLECLSCFADGISTEDENCYKGSQVEVKKCSDAEQCYTEVHPQYIKRGCLLPGSLNRTFVCKCPLCNDKPSYDSAYYEYTRLGDWEYDNKRLQKPIMAIDLICKVCQTTGMNKTIDDVCKFGQNADYMVCGNDQLCYTNINDQFDIVSRGCVTKPVFNSLHYFCNKDKCNNVSYQNPRLMPPPDVLFRTIPMRGKLTSGSPCNIFRDFTVLVTLQTFLFKSYYIYIWIA